MLRRLLLLSFAIVAAAATPARADRLGLIHGEAAMQIAGAEDVVSASFRGYLGVALPVGAPQGRWQHWIGGGGHLGSGVLYVDDPRALDGAVELGFSTMGPELRAGVAHLDGGYVNSQLYVAAARTRVGVDERLMLDRVDGVVGGAGTRIAVGATFPDKWLAAVIASEDGSGELTLAAIILPHAIELSWEDSAGSRRIGVSFGFGI
jgi:hypothetical protein